MPAPMRAAVGRRYRPHSRTPRKNGFDHRRLRDKRRADWIGWFRAPDVVIGWVLWPAKEFGNHDGAWVNDFDLGVQLEDASRRGSRVSF